MPERYDAARIAHDLGECRQRGLDWLDRSTTNQTPVRAAALQRLAEDYVAARRLVLVGRIDQIKLLLRHGIEQFTRQGHATEANLIRDLFFGESMDGAIKPPGELLKNARLRVGDTESRFRERRSNAMLSFAKFLVGFAESVDNESESARDVAPEYHQQIIVTGYTGDNEHFIQMLADAVKVTIVGITNEHLLPMLQEALRRKQLNGGPDAFWDSLRIVFLGNNLLAGINDEREQINDPREALRQRSRESFWAYKSVGAFLKRNHSSHWELYKCPHVLALTGSLFEFADHKKIVRLLIRRARRRAAEHLYIDLEDHADRFSAVFDDIVQYSASNYNVPVGFPDGDTFRCTGVRLHSDVLKDGSRASDWLPMVLVVTSRRRGGQVEPILQLRTMENSARELNRLSHLGGHILQEDCGRPADRQSAGNLSFNLTHEIPVCAAERLVREVAGLDPVAGLRPVGTGRYLYSDKEHLFFFIFSLELPEGTHFEGRAEMHAFPLSELLAVRASQVLRSAEQLCRTPVDSDRIWSEAAEVLALNLSLHDQAELGEQLLGPARRNLAERADTAVRITQLVAERATPSWAATRREVQLMGLAGWQYREFFSVLLPLYAEIGIQGAADTLGRMEADGNKRAARDRLVELYHDEGLMARMPMEL